MSAEKLGEIKTELIFAKYRRLNAAKPLESVAFYGILFVVLMAAIPYGTVDPWVRSLFVFLVCIFAVIRVCAEIISGKSVSADKLLFAPLIGILVLAIVQIIPFRELIGVSDNSSYFPAQLSMDPY